ncbi:MAG TPA: PKD domain-containing protein [Planctomycetota bacterium]|jgi:hypothetical protein
MQRAGVLRRCFCWSATVFVVLLSSVVAQDLPNTPRRDMWITDNTVNAVAENNGTIYIGGSFTYVGPYTGSGVVLTADTAQLAAPPPLVKGYVYTAVSDNAGGWYIGGNFTEVGGVARAGLAHILPDGMLDPSWDPNPDLTCGTNSSDQTGVRTLVLAGGTLYVGGYFTAIAGQARNRLAALDAATGAALSWDPNITLGVSTSCMIKRIAVSGKIAYIAGKFSKVGETARNYLAAVDADPASPTYGQATAWDPNPDSNVTALVVSGTTAYVGGAFDNIGGQARQRIAALDTDPASATYGQALADWHPNCGSGGGAGMIYGAMAISGTTLYAGGWFENVGGQPRKNIAALDVDPASPTYGQATEWNASVAGSNPTDMVVVGNTLYMAGWFSVVNGEDQSGFAGLDLTTGEIVWRPLFGVNASDGLSIAASGNSIFCGGYFESVGGVRRQSIAALDAVTGRATSWNPGTGGTVFALAVSNDTVYAGGDFPFAGGQPATNLAFLSAATGLPKSVGATVEGGVVSAMALSGNTLYLGGQFTSINTVARSRIGAVDVTTGTQTDWDPNANSPVVSLLLSGNTLYAGGFFGTIGGAARNRVAALDTTVDTNNALAAWNPNANANLFTMALSGSTLYTGGTFTNIGGAALNKIAALNADIAGTGQADATWNPDCNDFVCNLGVLEDGKTVLAGGRYTSMGGAARNNLAALDADPASSTYGQALAWNPDLDQQPQSLLATPRAVYVGGDFQNVHGQRQPYFAAFSLNSVTPTATLSPADDATGVSVSTALTLIFSKDVYKGDWGNVTIKRQSDGSVFESIAVTGDGVSVAGNVATITLSAPLAYGTAYCVHVHSDAFKDASGNYYAGIADDTTWNFATRPLNVVNVTSSAANATYKAGALIPIQVRFSDPVTVTGTPKLTLETGTTDAAVSYVYGSGSDTLTFEYIVAPGDMSADLDYTSTSALALNGGTIAANGAAAALTLPAPGAAGSLGANKALVIDTAPAPNVAPSIDSGITASPANPTAGDSVAFSASASDANNDALTYSWNFGDNTTATGAGVSHVYAVSGTYTVTLTVGDGKTTSSATLSLTVAAGGAGLPPSQDSDGDGFSNEIEKALGSDPNNASDMPAGAEKPVESGVLSVSKLSIKLNFAKPAGNDSIGLSGLVLIPEGLVINGQTVIVDVGGVVKSFKLDPKGKSPKANDSLAVSVKSGKTGTPLQIAKFAVKLSKGTFAAALADDGLTDETKTGKVTVPVTVLFNGTLLQKSVPQDYKATKSKSGATK